MVDPSASPSNLAISELASSTKAVVAVGKIRSASPMTAGMAAR
ncbi:hypothetical protein [Pengzhenrongella sp.]